LCPGGLAAKVAVQGQDFIAQPLIHTHGEEKILPLMGIEPWSSSPSLYWLNYPASFSCLLTYLLMELSASWEAANCHSAATLH
jgi:hypothetical protein